MPRAKQRRKLSSLIDAGAQHSGSECSEGAPDDDCSDEGYISDLVDDDEDNFSDDQERVKISSKERNQKLSKDELQLILENAGIECPYQNGKKERKRKKAKKGKSSRHPKQHQAQQPVKVVKPPVQQARVEQPKPPSLQQPTLPVAKAVPAPLKAACNFWAGHAGDDDDEHTGDDEALDWNVQPSETPKPSVDKSSKPLFGVFLKGFHQGQPMRPKSEDNPKSSSGWGPAASHVLRSDGTMYFQSWDGSKHDRGRITDGA